jgi:hypothetical protein
MPDLCGSLPFLGAKRVQSIAFPMRLQENGLLQRDDKATSLIALLRIMASTPAGSWAACPSFGLRDLFENSRQRADVAMLAAARINETFFELGIENYVVTEVVRELSPGRETDTYSITLENSANAEVFTTQVVPE